MRQTFATNLRRFRHAKGLSQEVLALEAGVNRTYLSKIEKGETHVGLEIIGKLATALDVKPHEFLVGASRKKAARPRVRKKSGS